MKRIEKLPREAALGTHFMGGVKAHYDQLVRLFGEPYKGSVDKKIQSEWVLETPAGIVTIYDYKSNISPDVNIDWHIGSDKKEGYGFITGILYASIFI